MSRIRQRVAEALSTPPPTESVTTTTVVFASLGIAFGLLLIFGGKAPRFTRALAALACAYDYALIGYSIGYFTIYAHAEDYFGVYGLAFGTGCLGAIPPLVFDLPVMSVWSGVGLGVLLGVQVVGLGAYKLGDTWVVVAVSCSACALLCSAAFGTAYSCVKKNATRSRMRKSLAQCVHFSMCFTGGHLVVYNIGVLSKTVPDLLDPASFRAPQIYVAFWGASIVAAVLGFVFQELVYGFELADAPLTLRSPMYSGGEEAKSKAFDDTSASEEDPFLHRKPLFGERSTWSGR